MRNYQHNVYFSEHRYVRSRDCLPSAQFSFNRTWKLDLFKGRSSLVMKMSHHPLVLSVNQALSTTSHPSTYLSLPVAALCSLVPRFPFPKRVSSCSLTMPHDIAHYPLDQKLDTDPVL